MLTHTWKKMFFVVLVLAALLSGTATTQASERGPFDTLLTRVEDIGAYTFTAAVEQTLIPRAIPANIGKSAERVDSQVRGEVTLPDQAKLTLRFESGTGLPVLILEQDGADTYLIQNGERTQIQNPLSGIAPAGDFASYLRAATNVQIKTDDAHPQFTIYTFDIDGMAYAAYVRDMLEQQFAASGQADVRVSLSKG